MAKAHPFPPAWKEVIRHYEAAQFAADREVRTVELRLYRLSKLAAIYPDGPGTVEVKDLTLYLGSNPRWKDTTQSIIQNSFKSFFRWAKKAKYIKSDPSKDLRKIPQVRTAGLAVPKKTVKAAVAGAKDERSRLMLVLNSHGLAAMEIAEARPTDVHEIGEDFYLRVYGKKSKSEDVPISPELAETLRSIESEYVFPGRINGHLSNAYISRLVSAELPAGISSRNVRGTQRGSVGLGQRKTWPDSVPFQSPDALGFMELADLVDNETLRSQLRRISRDVDRDPSAAIGACKEYLETLFKAVLDAKGVPYERDPFPRLWEKVTAALGLDAATGNTGADEGFGWMFEGLTRTVHGVGRIRNTLGTGHGHEESPATAVHSRLVFNATVTIAEFIAVTWNESNP